TLSRWWMTGVCSSGSSGGRPSSNTATTSPAGPNRAAAAPKAAPPSWPQPRTENGSFSLPRQRERFFIAKSTKNFLKYKLWDFVSAILSVEGGEGPSPDKPARPAGQRGETEYERI